MRSLWLKLCTFWQAIWHYSDQQKAIALLEAKISEVNGLQKELNERLKQADTIYTPVRSFNSKEGDKVFWPWARNTLLSEEYKYLIFTMRENCIKDLAQANNEKIILTIQGRMQMLQILDAYLSRGLTQYDAESKAKVQ